jgi:hypothetical protein
MAIAFQESLGLPAHNRWLFEERAWKSRNKGQKDHAPQRVLRLAVAFAEVVPRPC